MAGENKDYIKSLVALVFAVVLIVGGFTSLVFGMIGYYYTQGIAEQDLFGDRYKFACLTDCDDPETATYNESDELASWTAYQSSINKSNSNFDKLLTGVGLAFVFVGLYMLVMAVKSFNNTGGSSRSKLY